MKSLICSFLILSPPVAHSAQIIVPNNLDHAEGNTVGWPFSFAESGITSRRYQQVYDASQFGFIQPAGGYIKELWFRADMYMTFGQAGDFLDSVQINLGITARSPDSLSPVFSENISSVYTTVYGPSPLLVSTPIGWTIIPLTQPFLYVPAEGNLLLDIRTVDVTPLPGPPFPEPRRTLDAEDTLGDSISAVWANDVNASSGFVTTIGLVTLFQIEPIPEPGTWALLALGLFSIWRILSRRSR